MLSPPRLASHFNGRKIKKENRWHDCQSQGLMMAGNITAATVPPNICRFKGAKAACQTICCNACCTWSAVPKELMPTTQWMQSCNLGFTHRRSGGGGLERRRRRDGGRGPIAAGALHVKGDRLNAGATAIVHGFFVSLQTLTTVRGLGIRDRQENSCRLFVTRKMTVAVLQGSAIW